MFEKIKYCVKNNWRNILAVCASVILWLLVKENILGLSYPECGYVLIGALDFDKVDDNGLLGDDLYNSQTQGTILAVIKRTSNVTLSPIFTASEETSNNNLTTLSIFDSGGGNYRLTWQHFTSPPINQNFVIHGDTPILLDAWYFVAIVQNGIAAKLYVYNEEGVGGEETITGLVDGNTANWLDALLAGTITYRIGMRKRTSDAFVMAGLIDEVVEYDVALTQDEIEAWTTSLQKLFAFHDIPKASEGHWPLDDGKIGSSADGVTLKDHSHNEFDGLGDHGGNASGLTFQGSFLSYPKNAIETVDVEEVSFIPYPRLSGMNGGIDEGMHNGGLSV